MPPDDALALFCARPSGDRLNIKIPTNQYRDPLLKIRLSRDRIIFNTGIPYLGKTVFILKRGPPARTYRTEWCPSSDPLDIKNRLNCSHPPIWRNFWCSMNFALKFLHAINNMLIFPMLHRDIISEKCICTDKFNVIIKSSTSFLIWHKFI